MHRAALTSADEARADAARSAPIDRCWMMNRRSYRRRDLRGGGDGGHTTGDWGWSAQLTAAVLPKNTHRKHKTEL